MHCVLFQKPLHIAGIESPGFIATGEVSANHHPVDADGKIIQFIAANEASIYSNSRK